MAKSIQVSDKVYLQILYLSFITLTGTIYDKRFLYSNYNAAHFIIKTLLQIVAQQIVDLNNLNHLLR